MRYVMRLGMVSLIIAMSGLLWLSQSSATAMRSSQAERSKSNDLNGGSLDLGDAPDSTNSFGLAMDAYPSIPAKFPTVFDPTTGYPPGPSHINPQAVFLGDAVTLELEADGGADADGVNNLDPANNIANQDGADDAFYAGLPPLSDFVPCVPMQLQFRVTVNTMVSDLMFVNLWFDWSHNGQWGEVFDCPGQNFPSQEWAVQNQPVTFSGPGVYNFTTTAFLPNGTAAGQLDTWMRITLSETQASNADGRGPDNRWQYGETEDYLLRVQPEPTSTPTPRVTETPTPTAVGQPTDTPTPRITDTPTPTPAGQVTNTPTPINELIADLGDAPDSTNSSGTTMTTYAGAIPARFPTVFGPGSPAFGPIHHDIRLFNLGPAVTGETEADTGPDADPSNNIMPAFNAPNRDLADDGLVKPNTLAGFPRCQEVRLTYTVNYNGPGIRDVYFNMWADWNRNAAWGGSYDCPGAVANEWAVQNQVITLAPGLNTFVSTGFLPWHSSTSYGPFWMRMTVSESPALSDDGSGTANGWEYGETEDYFIHGDTQEPTATPTLPPQETISDLGDAPDSSNSTNSSMNAYPSVLARFPTVFGPGSPAFGPLHHDARLFFLGRKVTFEKEADVGPDTDVINNINPPGNVPNQDGADDGLLSPTSLGGYPHCTPTYLTYAVTNNGPPREVYFNMWADWNRNGNWGERIDCPTGLLADEWAVQNQVVSLAPGLNIFTTPAFTPWHSPNLPPAFWMRITISDTPASAPDGSGPSSGWRFGETEDYLIRGEPATPTPTKTPEPSLTPTPSPTPTPPAERRSDLGDAPDSSNSFNNTTMSAYTGVQARFPTVFGPGSPAFGPLHRDIRLFYLGRRVTSEDEADTGFDVDITHNISPTMNIADQDRADDGLVSPRRLIDIPNCKQIQVKYTVTYNGVAPRRVYFNLWSDWNRNGAWGGAVQCPNGLANEWAVQNQVITLAPGLNTFSTPLFIAAHPQQAHADLWFRMTVSETPAANDDGSGPATGWEYGETEDYYLAPDLGDAPDSHNSQLAAMPAYWWPFIPARFPTVYNRIPAFIGRGALHNNLGLRYFLGKQITAEQEADQGADSDPTNNLVLAVKSGNRDLADDAFIGGPPSTTSLRHCTPQVLQYQVTVPANMPPTQAYVNLWFDWNRNGEWGGVRHCKSWLFPWISNEWAVQNQVITLQGPGVYNFTTPVFFPYQPNPLRPAWMRITLSNTPATSANGSGPVGGWEYGETEDYLLRPKLVIGHVTGTVVTVDNHPLPGSSVLLITRTEDISASNPLQIVGRTLTDQMGHYSFSDVPSGDYLVLAGHAGFQRQWYADASEPSAATPIHVGDSLVSDIDFHLHPIVPPPVHVHGPGNVAYDPNTGHFTIRTSRQNNGDTQLIISSGCITCPNGIVPSNAHLELRYVGDSTVLQSYPVTFDSSSNTYGATITAGDLNALFDPTGGHTSIEVYLVWDCAGVRMEKFLGTIEIYDPSGVITDLHTGQPIEGATVALFHVPDWEARTSPSDTDLSSCESNLSRNGQPWSQEAPTDQGMAADPDLSLMSPAAPEQITGSDGHYGWDVGPGCWYVQVSAPGYATKVSPVVGIPSAVTDLDMALISTQNQIFLPTVQR